ncbi:formin-like protein 13 [Eucalyptus grandis]|uniref:formin-like protein 13 n=1 Tax=Eucalyptus grandis TaxID=71139 RepID=UPI00192ED5D2|nr:formin-like protein 13 [Eucalyptus grandis]
MTSQVSAPRHQPPTTTSRVLRSRALRGGRCQDGVLPQIVLPEAARRAPEICERVYVFDCCFASNVWTEEDYKVHMRGIVSQFQDHFHESSILVFNFREGEEQSKLANILSEYDMTIMDYPRQYEGCPLLTMEMIHHFLRSCKSWLSLGHQFCCVAVAH